MGQVELWATGLYKRFESTIRDNFKWAQAFDNPPDYFSPVSELIQSSTQLEFYTTYLISSLVIGREE